MNNANEVIKRSGKIYRDFTNDFDWQIKVHPIIKITATFVKHRREFKRLSKFNALKESAYSALHGDCRRSHGVHKTR